MARFYFHVHDGVSPIDTEGTDLPDWQTARTEAIQLAGEIPKDNAPRIALDEDWRIEVTDHTGLMLFQMTFQVIASPILERTARDEVGAD